MRILQGATLAVMLLGARVSGAAQVGSPDDWYALDVHAFVSPGFIYTTHQNNYLAASKNGSFEFTEVGLNFTKPLTENLRVGLQLFARDLGPLGNYSPKVDWFYVDYRFRDWLGFRAGRVKVPFGLFNEVSDVDSARVPVMLPQAVYPSDSRDFLLAQTGAELYGFVRLGRAGALDYRFYAGTIFLDTPAPTATVTFDSLSVPYLVGTRVMWETPLQGLRLGGTVQALRLDASYRLGGISGAIQLPAIMTVASVEYLAHDLQIAAEYGRWYTVLHSITAGMMSPDVFGVSERAYVMLSYRVNRWFWPGAYYSLLFPNTEHRASRDSHQHDLAATLRFDLNAHWLVKLEGHLMSGTANLKPALNQGRPLSTLAPVWGAFFVKTTAYF